MSMEAESTITQATNLAGESPAEQLTETPSAASSPSSSATTTTTTPLLERTLTNEEAMIAQALSRIKKNTKALEKTQKMLGQMFDSIKRIEKENQIHARQMMSQNKKIASQIAQTQKKIAKIKSAPTIRSAAKKNRKIAVNKAKTKSRSKRR